MGKASRLLLLILSANAAVLLISIVLTTMYEASWPAVVIFCSYFILIILFIAILQGLQKCLRLDELFVGIVTFIGAIAWFFGSDLVGARWIYLLNNSAANVSPVDTQLLDSSRFIRLKEQQFLYDKIGIKEVSYKSGINTTNYHLYVLPVIATTTSEPQKIKLFIELETLDQKLEATQLYYKSRISANIVDAIDNSQDKYELQLADELVLFAPSEVATVNDNIAIAQRHLLIFLAVLNFLWLSVMAVLRKTLFAKPELNTKT